MSHTALKQEKDKAGANHFCSEGRRVSLRAN